MTMTTKDTGKMKFGIPDDQAFFLLSQLFCLLYAFVFREILLWRMVWRQQSDRYSSKTTIYLLSFVPGLVCAYFCYGPRIYHIVVLATGCYLLLIWFGPKTVHVATFVFAMTYLSSIHVYRLFQDHKVYQLDASAPVMILVQKVTSLAFSIHDGWQVETKKSADGAGAGGDRLPSSAAENGPLSVNQRHNCIRERPTFLQYCAYVFGFQTILCGPPVSYVDYHEYLDGIQLRRHDLKRYPPVYSVLIRHLAILVLFAFLILHFSPRFPVDYLEDENFFQSNFFHKLLILHLVSTAARLKYYFAWKLAECVGNASGLGFTGFHPDGRPRYDLMDNIDIAGFELAWSLRDALAAWNKSTTQWLRTLAYDRAPKSLRILAVYVLSALWHGFFPGYYITFLTGGLFTVASRMVRKRLRPRFVAAGQHMLTLYHFGTFLATRICIAYIVVPFMMLDIWPIVQVYNSVYWFLHVAAIVGVIVLPMLPVPVKAENGHAINCGSVADEVHAKKLETQRNGVASF